MIFEQVYNYINKIIIFFLPELANYWNSITKCNLKNKPKAIGKYYLDFSSKYFYKDKFDANGIPLFSLKKQKDLYHPIVVCQYALGVYEFLFRSDFKDEILRKIFLNQAEWLTNNYIQIQNYPAWLINLDVDQYNLKSPWISAMAQGEAISVLTRAFNLTGDKKYLTIAEMSLNLFEIPVSKGGIVNYFRGCPVYEEYPVKDKTVAVLNGFIFSLFGLYDLFLTSKNNKAEKLFLQGVNSLKELLKYYDMGYWSQYHLYDFPKFFAASLTYHYLAFEQLNALYVLTGEEVLRKYYYIWSDYSNKNFNKIRALIKKLTPTNKKKFVI
jgi:heparosan-N-sulfate-glucuronate 5-epimerase